MRFFCWERDSFTDVIKERGVLTPRQTHLRGDFLSAISPVAGSVSLTIAPPMDATVFPDELQKLGGKRSGLYLLSTKQDGRVIYIGISDDIPRRIYVHIGPGFIWARAGTEAAFSGCSLAAGRHWLSETTQEHLRKTQVNVTAVLPDPPEASALLEALLVFWGHRKQLQT